MHTGTDYLEFNAGEEVVNRMESQQFQLCVGLCALEPRSDSKNLY